MNKVNSVARSELSILLLGFLISISLGFGLYQYYQFLQRKKLLATKDFEKAIKEFCKVIKQINEDIQETDIILAGYKSRLSLIYQALEKIFPEQENNNTLRQHHENIPSPEWTVLFKSYDEAIRQYPETPELEKMSTTEIYRQCNLFQRHHQKVLSLCEYMAQKSSQDLRQYEERLTHAHDLLRMKQ